MQSAVHVTVTRVGGLELFECDCALYRLNNSANHQSTCPQIRFISEYVLPNISLIPDSDQEKTNIHHRIVTAKKKLDHPVAASGSFSPEQAALFSVIPPSIDGVVKPGFVSVSRHGFIRCKTNECGARVHYAKGVHNFSTLHTSKKLCPHLTCVGDNPGELQQLFHHRENQRLSEKESEDVELFADIEMNHVKGKLFDTEAQQWVIPAYSKHKPVWENDSLLISCTERRLRKVGTAAWLGRVALPL